MPVWTGRIPPIMSGFDECRCRVGLSFSTVSTSRHPSLLELQFGDGCHTNFLFSWLHVFLNQSTAPAIRRHLLLERRKMCWVMWEEGHGEHIQRGSKGCQSHSRAHNFFWISQRPFQSISSWQCPVYLLWFHVPALPAPSYQGGWALACLSSSEMLLCQCSWNKGCKEVSGFCQRQLLQLLGLVQGQLRSVWQEQAGHQAASELHLLLGIPHPPESCQGKERGDPAPHPLFSCPIPLGWFQWSGSPGANQFRELTWWKSNTAHK